jgi:ABC-2 type transport system permease protein
MSRIVADIRGFAKMYLRSWVGAFFTFAFPILLILLFGAIFTSSEGTKISMPIQNMDNGPYSKIFLSALNDTGVINVKMIPDDVDIMDYISDNSLTLALLIPDNFSDQVAYKVATNESGFVNVTMYGDLSSSTFGTAQAVVSSAITGINYYLEDAEPIISFDTQSVAAKMTFMDFFLPGVVGITVMTTSLYSMSSVCASYRERGYFKLLATTKLKKYEWLTSKFIFYSIVLFVSLLATYAVGVTAFDMKAVMTPLALVMIPAGAFLFVSLGMLIGVAVKDPESSSALANAIGFPMMFLSGAFFQLEAMPMYMQAIAAALPLTYFNNGLRDTMVYGNTASALVNLAVLLAFGVVFFLLASRLMSWKEK